MSEINDSDALADLDDLLSFDDVADTVIAPTVEESPLVEESVEEKSPEETLDQLRIRELQEELGKPEPKVVVPEVFVPVEQLNEDQKRIRELEDQLARKNTRIFENSEDQYEILEGEETILIHFVEDGLTALGRVWYTGQELEFAIGGKAYEQTKNRFGVSWVEQSENDQIEKRGKVYFRRGAWPGKQYDNSAASAAERKRRRAAPVLTS